MKMTNAAYNKHVSDTAPKSKLGVNMVWAFCVGGLICVLGQASTDMLGLCGLDTKTASAATSIALVFLAAFLTAIGVYDNIAKKAGAGTLVPITGFANAMVSPAMEFKSEGLVAGVAARMFTIAGPVLVYGIVASVLYGLILALFML